MSALGRRIAFAAGRLLLCGTVGSAVACGVFASLGLLAIVFRDYAPQSIGQIALVGAGIGLVAGPFLGLLRLGNTAGAAVEGLAPGTLYLLAALMWLTRESGVFQTPSAAVLYLATGTGVLVLGGGISGYLTCRVMRRLLQRLDERYVELATSLPGEASDSARAGGPRRYRF